MAGGENNHCGDYCKKAESDNYYRALLSCNVFEIPFSFLTNVSKKYKTDLFPNVNNDSFIMEALTSAAEH